MRNFLASGLVTSPAGVTGELIDHSAAQVSLGKCARVIMQLKAKWGQTYKCRVL